MGSSRRSGLRRFLALAGPRILGAALAALLASPFGVGRALAAPVRVFAVGHKQSLADAVSVESFRAKMRALVDARFRGASGLVQPGVDDIASHVRPHDPGAPALAVAHFPEDTGLVAGLIGSRGQRARASSSSIEAFAILLGTYGDVIAHYDGRFPELAALPLRGLVVALTDVLYRSVYETFREIAIEHALYVSVSLNVASARRVEAGAAPQLVELLRGPDEPERAYAYEATSDLPHNVVWLFDPSGEILVPDGAGGLRRSPSETGGELLPSSAKAYLTPIEQSPDKPGGGLSLAAGSVNALEVLDTPVGAIGVVISKDAWMPDVNERLDAKGATLMLQSEAFSGWAFTDVEWDPDTFKQGGFGNLQSHGGFLVNVAPSMTGNLFDVTFDGQSAIIGKRREKPRTRLRDPDNGWIGQVADSGFLRIAPWIVPDPALPDTPEASLPLAARRRSLVESGVDLLPGSGVSCTGAEGYGPCENGYREWILSADLDLPPGPGRSGLPDGPDAEPRIQDRGGVPTTFGVNFAIAPGGRGRQRHPRIAADDDVVAVAWDDTREGPVPAVWLAISRDRGTSFSAPRRASSRPAGEAGELFPDVAVRGADVFVVWQTFARGLDDDAGAIEIARFDVRGERRSEARVDGGEDLPPAGRWQPALALLPDGEPFVAWIDERDRGIDGVALEHVYAARGAERGTRFSPAVRVDRGTPVPLAEAFDNKWSPAVTATENQIHVAWVDFRDYNWDVYTASSSDGGASFGADLRVNGYPDFERICDSPRLSADAGGSVLLAWTDTRARQPNTEIYVAESRGESAPFGEDRPLLDRARGFDPNRDVPASRSHVALTSVDSRMFAAWQDDGSGNNDVLFAPIDGDRPEISSGNVSRVDDTGEGPSNQYRPQIAIAGGGSEARCIVVWEDDREGRLRVYGGARACTPAREPLPTKSVPER